MKHFLTKIAAIIIGTIIAHTLLDLYDDWRTTRKFPRELELAN